MMANNKIVFSGFMATILLISTAHAAPMVASKEYVDAHKQALRTEVTQMLDDKADKSTTYTKTEVDNAIAAGGQDLSGYATTTELNDGLATKASVADMNSALTGKEDLTNKTQVLYEDDAYEQNRYPTSGAVVTFVGDQMNLKADKADTPRTPWVTNYVETRLNDYATNYSVNTKLAPKENLSNKVTTISGTSTDEQYPSARAVNTALDGKADKSNTYTKQEVDNAIVAGGQDLSGYATTTELNDGLATKANTADLGNMAFTNNVQTANIVDENVTKPKLSADVQASLDRADIALRPQDLDLDEYEKKVDVDAKLTTKANADYVADIKSDVDSLYTRKAEVDDVYLKNETDTKLDTKADKATTYTKTEVDNAIAAIPQTDVSGKMDKVPAASAGNFATFDSAGNVIDSGIPDSFPGEVMPRQPVAISGNIPEFAPGGMVIDSGISKNVINNKADKATTYTKTEVDNAIAAVPMPDISGKENLSNKSNSIASDTGSTTKYTTVNAVETYAIPKPGANCMGAQAQCVLAVNKNTGEIYWEDVAVANP